MVHRIDSRKNPQFRRWLAISRQAPGRPKGQVFLEGLRLCQDAVRFGVAVEAVLLSDQASEAAQAFAWSLAESDKALLPHDLFRSLGETQHPQGIGLVVAEPAFGPPAGPARPDGLYLVADRLADPGNLGTVIRTAHAFSFDAVLIIRGGVRPVNPKVIRASMGSCFQLPLALFDDLAAAAAWLKGAGLPLLAADGQGTDLASQLPAGGQALIIGNEAHGQSPQALALADRTVRIPMPGQAESLNVSAAAAIFCYLLAEKRHDVQAADAKD